MRSLEELFFVPTSAKGIFKAEVTFDNGHWASIQQLGEVYQVRASCLTQFQSCTSDKDLAELLYRIQSSR